MILAAVTPDRVSLSRSFNDLAIALSRSDSELTDAVRSRNRVGDGWENWFSDTAESLLQARDAFGHLAPEHRGLFDALTSDSLDLAESAGQLGAAYRDGDTFGAGWDTTLDDKINHVREAADLLLAGSSGAEPYPVNA